MAMRSLAPGFRFHPTDVELVLYYLKKKVLGKRFRNESIAELDIYNFPPWDLPDHARLSRDLKWYFFCPRERKYATGARTNRSTDYGFWKTTGNDRPVIYKDQTVGKIRSLIFHLTKTERTDWVMHEYRLEDEDLKTKGVAQDTFVLCEIYEKDGRGPRNGAQYGAPFVEEEWEDDDDREADVPSASGFTREFILPDMQQHSERHCIGSTSNASPAGPSQIVPSDVNVPPPAPADDITMEDTQNPFDNGIFSDDIPPTSSEDDRVENLDPINPDGDHGGEYTTDDIFNSLEPFMELNDIDDLLTSADGPGLSGHNNSEGLDRPIAAQSVRTSAFVGDENFRGLWLKDLEIPITCDSEAGQSNEVYVDASFSNLGGNDGLVGSGTISNPPVFAQPFHVSEVTHNAEDFPRLNRCPQSVWTSLFADDENFRGMWLKDLETPIARDSEAGQSNEVYVDASFSNLGGNDGLVGSATIPNPPDFAQSFHGSEVTRDAEDLPWLNRCPQLGVFDGCVDMHQEGYGVECTNQEIVRYDAVAANSSIDNPDVECVHACENQGRGEGTIFCCMLRFLEYPAHPSSAVERPAPCIGAKRFDGHALFLLYGYSSFHIKAEVTLGGGGRGCTNDALSCGLEGFPFATDREENGSGSGKGAANYGCGISSTLFLLTLRLPCCPPWGDMYYWRLTSWLSFLAAAWLIVHISVWCACIELSVSSVFMLVLHAFSSPFAIRSISAPHVMRNLLITPISVVSELGSLFRFQLISNNSSV